MTKIFFKTPLNIPDLTRYKPNKIKTPKSPNYINKLPQLNTDSLTKDPLINNKKLLTEVPSETPIEIPPIKHPQPKLSIQA